jgi:hypothetical protein
MDEFESIFSMPGREPAPPGTSEVGKFVWLFPPLAEETEDEMWRTAAMAGSPVDIISRLSTQYSARALLKVRGYTYAETYGLSSPLADRAAAVAEYTAEETAATDAINFSLEDITKIGRPLTTDELRLSLLNIVNPINAAVDADSVADYLSLDTSIFLLDNANAESDIFIYEAAFAAKKAEAQDAIDAIPAYPTEYQVRNTRARATAELARWLAWQGYCWRREN